MNTEHIKSLYDNLKELYEAGKFHNSYIVVFGANKPADRTIDFLKTKGIAVDAIIDNNSRVWNQKKFGIPVSSPESVLGKYRRNAVILVASKYYDEMCMQLKSMGYEPGQHVFQTIKFTDYSIDKDTYDRYCDNTRKGLELYESMRLKYGTDVEVMLSPCSGLGDMYLTGKYLKSYLKKNNISNYIMAVVGRGSERVASLYGITQTVLLSQNEMDSLVTLRTLLGGNVNIRILLHCYRHTDILAPFELIDYGINWGDLYKYALFELTDADVIDVKPSFHIREKDILEEMNRMGIQQGKSVLLAPYAASLTSVSDYIWETIANKLKNAGYSVYTNCFGATESPIRGTQPAAFTVAQTKAVLEYMGGFIGLRSGICDIASAAVCKKVIIYPDELSMKFYSLNGMELCNDAVEITNVTERQTILQCLKEFGISELN